MLVWWGWRPSNVVKRLVNRPEWGSAPPLLPLRAVEVGVRPLAACTDVPVATALLLTFPHYTGDRSLVLYLQVADMLEDEAPASSKTTPGPSKHRPFRISWAICCGVVILEAECTPCNRLGPYP